MRIVIVSNSFLNNSNLAKFFSQAEITELLKTRPAHIHSQSLMGRMALKYASGPTNFHRQIVNYNSLGQPTLRGSNLHYSISHSQNMAAAAVSSDQVGIDIEKIQIRDPSLLKLIASEKEINLFPDTPADELVTKIWTIKESVAKAMGTGIAYSFRKIIIHKEGQRFIVKANGIKWQSISFKYNEYIISYSNTKTIFPKELTTLQYLL